MDTDIKLPMPAERLVPHRPPFLLVDRLLDFTGQTGVVESVLTPDNLFIDEDGHFQEIAMIEILAQSAAAVKGYSDLKEGKGIRKGFLEDIREFLFKRRCYKGDSIHSRIEITRSFSGFSVLNGSLKCTGKELAYGTLKLWVPDDSEE